jgi:SAM-dependent methyltransferase
LLPASGRALAVADGEGRNGVWLVAQGLDVVAVEFSPSALRKARALAKARGVTVTFVEADVHSWQYPEVAFDVVVEIFTQFSSPAERAIKWVGMRRALKPGGFLIVQGWHRVEAEGLAVPLRTLARLDQEQEPGRACRQAGGRRGLVVEEVTAEPTPVPWVVPYHRQRHCPGADG